MRERIYKKNESTTFDEEFTRASSFGKVKLGTEHIFWRKGVRWYFLELRNVQRVFRRIEAVETRMCCSNVNFEVQKLVCVLKDDTELEIMIGEVMPREAEKLYGVLKERQPNILYGKV